MDEKMSEVSNFEVGHTEEFGSQEVTGSGIVTAVDANGKTVTVELTPEAVAQKIQEDVKELDPVETAAKLLTLYTPRYNALVDQLSTRALKRLSKALAIPVLGKELNHGKGIEQEAFEIAKRMRDAEFVIVLHTYANNQERIINEAAKAAGNEEGSNNG